MNKHSRFTFAAAFLLVLLAVYVVCELTALAAPSSATVQLVASSTRVKPGETVQFSLKLVDSNGRTQSIPSSGSPPQLVLEDSQGREIGVYSFRFG